MKLERFKLERLRVVDLLKILKSWRVKNVSRLRKAQLIKLILKLKSLKSSQNKLKRKKRYGGALFGINLRPTIKKIDKVDKIRGPVTLTHHYSPKYGKTVYIFGDYHIDFKMPCESKSVLKIDDFIQLVLDLNVDKVIDIMLEMRYFQKNEHANVTFYPEQGFLFGDVADKWKTCLTPDKSLCKVQNLRMHYTDPRLSPELTNFYVIFKDFLPAIWDQLNESYVTKTPVSQSVFGTESIENFLSQIEENIVVFEQNYADVNKLLFVFKIDKQIAAVTNITVRNAIYKFFIQDGWSNPKLSWKPSQIRALVTTIRNFDFKVATTLEQVSFVGSSTNAMVDWVSWLMDAYLISRMFRSFQSENNTNRYSDDPHYIIIYAGNVHSDRYRHFLDQNLQFQLLKSVEAKNTQCLDISDFEQPFFRDSAAKYIESLHMKQSVKLGFTVTQPISSSVKSN